MAAFSIERYGDDVFVFVWNLTSADPTGDPVGADFASFADRVVQVTGTLGTGSGVALQGSNDRTNWAALNDNWGGDLTPLAVGSLNSVAEVPLWTRPVIGTPGSGASITVRLSARRNRPGKSIGG